MFAQTYYYYSNESQIIKLILCINWIKIKRGFRVLVRIKYYAISIDISNDSSLKTIKITVNLWVISYQHQSSRLNLLLKKCAIKIFTQFNENGEVSIFFYFSWFILISFVEKFYYFVYDLEFHQLSGTNFVRKRLFFVLLNFQILNHILDLTICRLPAHLSNRLDHVLYLHHEFHVLSVHPNETVQVALLKEFVQNALNYSQFNVQFVL